MELQTKRFLILDDQLVLRKLISRQASFFKRYALEIDEFSDPAEALRSISEGGYHLIITDIGMPGMNGIDFIKNVARLGYHSALLIISGYDGKTLQNIAEMASSLGMPKSRFLAKPYSSEVFVEMLNSIFNDLERVAPSEPTDVESVFSAIFSDRFQLELEPVLALNSKQAAGFAVESVLCGDATRYGMQGLLRLLATRPGASAVLLETVVERLGRLLQTMQLETRLPECQINVPIDYACLASDNVFDHCFALLQQHDVPSSRIGFELSEGLSGQASALCFENIAKIKYLGFRLVASDFGSGSLTVGNMLKLPFDHVNVPLETLRWIRLMQGEDPNAFRVLRSYGLAQTALTATGLDVDGDLALALSMGCPLGRGRQVAASVAESALPERWQALAGKSGLASGGAGI
ncbi:hypothetical protein CEK28_08320 [Xenophilus sp. AP218F]|nr:EAL domain-containing protein [Chromobacterium sp. ASV5]OWY39467.1 hypothetical protein CEK28_08320 [Xenophilus sp. AP218F]